MSKATELLEAAVADVIANRPADGQRATARQRAASDRAFARVLKIIAPRIRHFIKQYGLAGHWDDAEQVCAIAVHRAIEAYDPVKAMFTTFVNWQIRGELQGLRFRLMEDQRPSARKVEAVTISLHMTERGPEGEEISLEAALEDEYSLSRTEAAAADHLARSASQALMDEYVRHLRTVGMSQLRRKAQGTRSIVSRPDAGSTLPKYVHHRHTGVDPAELDRLEERIARDRDIVARHLFALAPHAPGQDGAEGPEEDRGLTKERIRQITRRAARVMAEIAASHPRFATAQEDDGCTEEGISPAQVPVGIYPPLENQAHNALVSVSAAEDMSGETISAPQGEQFPAERRAGRAR